MRQDYVIRDLTRRGTRTEGMNGFSALLFDEKLSSMPAHMITSELPPRICNRLAPLFARP